MTIAKGVTVLTNLIALLKIQLHTKKVKVQLVAVIMMFAIVSVMKKREVEFI